MRRQAKPSGGGNHSPPPRGFPICTTALETFAVAVRAHSLIPEYRILSPRDSPQPGQARARDPGNPREVGWADAIFPLPEFGSMLVHSQDTE